MNTPINPSVLAVGTRIHAFEVVSCLGQGGMGTVYKVIRDGKSYALKLTSHHQRELSAEQLAQADARARREVATLATISHPNVVQIRAFDHWPTENGSLYIVTDIIDGQPLIEWQQNNTPSYARLACVFRSIAEALGELHRHQIFHRDLKSDNVLVRSDGEPFLIDFGIARHNVAYTLTSAGSIVGTRTHLSPRYCRHITSLECSRGERYNYLPTDDLHAVGIMLYEMLTGVQPFVLLDNDEWSLLLKIAHTPPTPPSLLNPALPKSLSDIVMRLLAKEASDCFQSGQELALALTNAIECADILPRSPLADPGLSSLLLQDEPAPSSSESPFQEPDLLIAPFEAPLKLPPEPPADAQGQRWELPEHLLHVPAQIATRSNDRRRIIALCSVVVIAVVAIQVMLTSLTKSDPRSLLARFDDHAHSAQTSVEEYLPTVLEPARSEQNPKMPERQLTSVQANSRQLTSVQANSITVLPVGSHPSHPSNSSREAPVSDRPQKKRASAVPWLKSAQSLDDERSATETAKLQLPFGIHLQAKLMSAIDSRSIDGAIIEAILTSPLLLKGEPVLPARTMLYGAAKVSGGRVNIRFSRLRLPDDREIAFSGSALDPSDGKFGLAPSRRISASPRAGDLGKIVQSTASFLLGKVGGSSAADVATMAGQQLIHHDETSSQPAAEILLLDPGDHMEVIITDA